MTLHTTTINRNKTSVKSIEYFRAWEEDGYYYFELYLGDIGYPKALVTAYEIKDGDAYITIDWTKK